MKNQSSPRPFEMIRLSAALFMVLTLWLLVSFAAQAAQLTINVVGVSFDANGNRVGSPFTAGYRWTVEEDATKASIPGRPADTSNYSFSFHTSYMPVVAAGRVGAPGNASTQDPDVLRLYNQALPDLDPAKRYYVSIAAEGYQMGGAPVVFGAGGATATVYLNQYPLPTAQISVFVFQDNNPINGAPDLPQEGGLAGFTVKLIEAGGTYGQSGGEVTQDAFANPLGTTYNADGSVKDRGNGIVLTGADGTALIKNLYPGKYTIYVAPPNGSDWHQTSTIEGTKGIDAWVKNNEPSFFQEFGPPGHHVFIGFVKSGYLAGNNSQGNPCVLGNAGCTPVLSAGKKITGTVVNTHNSRPPVFTFYNRAPVSECWVGLNELNGGRALYATPCRKDSSFEIPNVPNGTYELVVWDEPLDIIIATTTVCVGPDTPTKRCSADGDLAMGTVPVTSWFGRYQGRVFQDIDGTGLPFFANAFNRPYVKVDPMTGVETQSTQAFAAGDLKPPFGAGIASNIRFRDGSIYQSTITKDDGTFAFTEVFPFFNWMVAEIDYARFKATSATVVVDEGGCVKVKSTDCNAADQTNEQKLWKAQPGLFGSNDPALAYDPWIRLNPQAQPENGGKFYRTESVGENPGGTGAVLLEGMQTFLGQTNHIEWGKVPYKIDENGGIAGIVHYAITRAEDDPRFAAAENWEPGIPRVQVNLFLDCNGDGIPDQPKNDGSGLCAAGGLSGPTTAGGDNYAYDPPDVDNYPYCWRDASTPASCPSGVAGKGPEDVKRSRTGDAVTFSYGDVFRWGAPGATSSQPEVGLGKTDSWDDSIPTGCPDVTPYVVPNSAPPKTLDCFDGLRNFNQVRPSVFDGGYAFGRVAAQAELPMIIGAEGQGKYIVEAVAPPGYLHQGNGDKNVVFGDTLQASTAALPFECVGMELPVPEFLTLFPGESNPNYSPGATWRKCDMKAVPLLPGTNPAPDFYMFTEAPVAGHGVGFILDDTSAEFNHFAPNFGEKYAPPHMPISIQDWTGREISRVYSDQFGSYNFLVPSSFTINPPFPSGVMPSMMVACMNHPGPVKIGVNADGSDQMGIDPFFNRAYSQFCYTLQYLAGKTTYLDTPVVPVAAFAAVDKNPLDCECADGTPAIYSANNGTDNGPWVSSATGANRQLTIVSAGTTQVLNPAFDPAATTGPNSQRIITRDYGFGSTPGAVTLGGVALTGVSWNAGVITATVPTTVAAGAYQLIVKRGDNAKESVVGLTVHVGGNAPKKVNLAGTNGAFKTIQQAIDAPTTLPGDLITVAPGTYKEYVIMDKRIRLQGWGAGSTMIDAGKSTTATLAAWRALLSKKLDPRCSLANGTAGSAPVNGICPVGTPIDPDTGAPAIVAGPNRSFDPLPGQNIGINATNNEPILFGAEEGPGVLLVGKAGPVIFGFPTCGGSEALRVDGLTVTGGDAGGGVLASSYACDLQVSNNRVVSNYGTYGGGVRIGHTALATAAVVNGVEVITYVDGVNRRPNIHHNWISQNGATEQGGGGGVTLGTGSNSYTVADNYVCGNFSMADGGGLSHLGKSLGLATPLIGNGYGTANLILRNKFIFNQTFNQSADPMGGGLSIASQVPQGGAEYEGTGDVIVDRNLIQGNQAGAGSGGGVSLVGARSGLLNLGIFSDDILLTNNMIVNNVAAYTGGGVSLTGTGAGVRLVNNTVASNVSTATNRQAFGTNSVAQGSQAQIAGISVLDATSPTLLNNIVWGNRSYIFTINGTTTALIDPPSPIYRDLGRVSGSGDLAPTSSIFTTGTPTTGITPSATNQFVAANSTALFVKPDNFLSIVDPTQPVVLQDQTVALQTALTFDETGNFINVIFSPLTQWVTTPGPNFGTLRADYHIKTGSPAVNVGANRVAGSLIPLVAPNRVPTTDYDGEARTTTNVDVGADELIPPSADLSITKTDGVTSINPGGTVTYAIVVSNAGPLAVTGATVTDTFPSTLTVNSWTCAATAGSSCTATGTGVNRTGSVNLLNGGSASYTANVTLAASATGTLANTVTVAAPAGITDPNTGNNSATDTDTIVIPLPTLSVLDNFNRANAATLSANWSQTTGTGTVIRVNSNQAQCALLGNCVLGTAIWNGTTNVFGAKQGAAFTFTSTPVAGTSLYLKASGGTAAAPASFIRVRYTGIQAVVETTTNSGGAYTTRGSFAATFANGDRLSAVANADGSVDVWKTTAANVTTSLGRSAAVPGFTGTGRIGMQLLVTALVDNFAGGTVP